LVQRCFFVRIFSLILVFNGLIVEILKRRIRLKGLILTLTAFLALLSFRVNATHLMGGSMTYEYQGMVGPNYSYKVTLKIYRYCDSSAGGTAPLDGSMYLGIYNQDPLNPNADKNWYTTIDLLLINQTFITPPSPGVDCSFSTTVCVEEGIFEADILLPPNAGGYHLMVERCCRNGNIANLSTPGSIGQTYYCFVPPAPIINSSPQFSDIPVPFICSGDTVTIVNNAVDPDGDQLVYSFETPFSGYSSSVTAVPDPQFDNNPYAMPIPPVLYNPGYTMPSPFGAGGTAYIDTQTGLTKYYIPNQGFYVVAIEIKEYRNGVLIASVRRDIQLIAIACPVNAMPVISTASGGGQTNFTITEGQTLCFPITFTDPNGDSLFLTSSGTVFDISAVNPIASLANASGDGIVTSQFCWSTECGMTRAAPYQFVVSVIDNGCPPKVTNQIYSITVDPSPLPPAPAVSIMQTPPGAICMGTSVTFTAIPTFGGTNPSYQWQLNGVNVGANSNTYTNASLSNGDIITVSMVSNSVCINSFNAVSPPVVMVVNPFVAPLVSISALPAGPVCAGTNVTFTALPVNPGATPVYQWTVNGVNVGTNSPVFSSTTLMIGDQVEVSLLADPSCPPAESNVINMTVNPLLVPSVLLTSDAAGSICPGQLVTFRAYPTNGGGLPAYQWQINGVNVGTNSNTFSSSTLNNGDNVSVIMTSNENCTTPLTATSNVINIIVSAATNPSVSITANPSGPVCADDNIVFTASPVSGGTAPAYQWFVNGVFTGFVGSSWATASLNNGDQVSVLMTSSLLCLTTVTATSNIIPVTVNPLSILSANITVSPSNLNCAGTLVTFTATSVNGGTAPFYQWQINGINVGTNSTTFSTSTLVDGDRVEVQVTSNQSCVSPVVAKSNQIMMLVLPLINPSVSIVSNTPGSFCQGTMLSFTATPLLGGASPGYQWYVNGNPVGPNSATYSSNLLIDGDVISVQLTSSANCPMPPVVASNNIIVDVIPLSVPQVSFNTSPGWPVCEGQSVTLTAFPVNGGAGPVYQWQINGVAAASGSTFTTSTLNDGDSIRVVMWSNAICASPPAIGSDTVIADILPILTPAAAVYITPGGPVCAGDSISFSTAVTNGGAAPVYQWYLNNLAVGTNAPAYAGIFNDGDSIKAIVTSSYQCLTNPSDTTNTIITNVLPILTPSVSITVNPLGAVCPGDLLSFSSAAVNEGSSPIYQWSVNGVATGGNSSFLNSATLSNGDLVNVHITSSEMCLAVPGATSNTITVQISPNIAPDITINISPSGSVCDGDSLSFSTAYTGGGSLPNFVWRVNGVPNGIVGSVFATDQLNNNDIIDVILESSAFCALPTTDTSNKLTAVIDPLLTPVAVISANPPGVFCDGMEITYNAATVFGGLNPGYQWLLNGGGVGSNIDSLISSLFLDGDTVQLQLTSSEKCLALNPALSNQIIIDRLPPLEPLIAAPAAICFGEEVILTASATGGNGGPYYLTVDNSLGNGDSFIFTPFQTATYTLTVSDSCSTPRTYSTQIVVNPLPDPAFTTDPPQTTILNPFFNFIDASVNATSWFWDFGDGTISDLQFPSHTYVEPGYYKIRLEVMSSEGCTDSISKELIVENIITYYIPNAFTPNGDGRNDDFMVSGYSIAGYEMQIYNRWGQQVFHTSGPFDKWKGNDLNGKPVQEGVYTYVIRIFNEPGSPVRNGMVTLVR